MPRSMRCSDSWWRCFAQNWVRPMRRSAERSPALHFPLPSSFRLLGVNAEIIAIGSELLTPFRQDTNSLFLTDRLNQLGIEVHFKDVVGDNRDQLVSVARIAISRTDISIFMGGLGPTEDDLTREAVAEALGITLNRDSEIIAEIERRFTARPIAMVPNNLRQADVLAGATVLPNPNGSAPGKWLQTNYAGKHRIIILLPGPPHELTHMSHAEGFER